MDVADWLKSLGLEQYESAFRTNKADTEVLPRLPPEALKDLGVVLLGDRRRLMEAIKTLQERTETTTPIEHPPMAERMRRCRRY